MIWKILDDETNEKIISFVSDNSIISWQKDFTPLSDLRSSAEYRQATAHNLLLRYYFETLGANTNVQQVAP